MYLKNVMNVFTDKRFLLLVRNKISVGMKIIQIKFALKDL